MLSELHLRDVGPAPALDVEFAERLNIFTGDNGLGKTFLLDCAWWALTGSWAYAPALARNQSRNAAINFVFDGKPDKIEDQSLFDYRTQNWPVRRAEFLSSCPAVYARIDGGFSVFDPFRGHNELRPGIMIGAKDLRTWISGEGDYAARNFTADEILNGLEIGKRSVINGLIRDWVSWQRSPLERDGATFQTLRNLIKKLAHPDEKLEVGEPMSLYINDVREFPTIQTDYGTLPITHASSGMIRIITLAYILTWTWREHCKRAVIINESPRQNLHVIMDEVELHLHPRWQRSLLPSLLEIGSELNGVDIQVFTTTHSPLVLASIEPEFNEETDRLFLFDIDKGQVELKDLPWAKHGDATNWLTSEVFGLHQARSREAETAIEAAEAFMRRDYKVLPTGLETQDQIHAELLRVLPGLDKFWRRWLVPHPQEVAS